MWLNLASPTSILYFFAILILRSRWWAAKHPGPNYFETLLLYQTNLQIDTSAFNELWESSPVFLTPKLHGRPPCGIHETNWGLEAIWRQRKLRNYWTKGKLQNQWKMSGAAVVRDLKPGRHLPMVWTTWQFLPLWMRASPIFGRVTFWPHFLESAPFFVCQRFPYDSIRL